MPKLFLDRRSTFPGLYVPGTKPIGEVELNPAHFLVDEKLRAYYLLQQKDGPLIKDLTGHVDGVFDSGYYRNNSLYNAGTEESANLGTTDDELYPGTSDFTVVARILPESMGSGVYSSIWDGLWSTFFGVTNYYGFRIRHDTGGYYRLEGYVSGTKMFESFYPHNISSGFATVALRRNGTSVDIWIDGIVVGSNTNGDDLYNRHGSHVISLGGRDDGVYNYDGFIDYAFITDKALSDIELCQLCDHPYSSGPTPLLIPKTPKLILISGGVVGGTVLITADPITSVGTISGSPVMSVSKSALIDAIGSLTGTESIAVSKSALIDAVGSLAGTESIAVSKSALIDAATSVQGQPVIAVEVAAQLISATGSLLGTVGITTPGNVLIAAEPISSTGTVTGQHIISVSQSAIIDAVSSLVGSASTGLTIAGQPISATGTLAGGSDISVTISADAVEAIGSTAGQVVQNVLMGAVEISASGSATGLVQVIGPGQLGVISDPGVVSKTPIYAIVTVSPIRGVTH